MDLSLLITNMDRAKVVELKPAKLKENKSSMYC